MHGRRWLGAAIAIGLAGWASSLPGENAAARKSYRVLRGLHQPVEVLRDRWGVPHIYAKNTEDLFFAQGYMAANDRLFQLELWRRASNGHLAEVLGPNFVARDRIARLVRYRGDWDAEWRSYADNGKQVVASFVAGLNAYITGLGDERPLEFRVAGFSPGLWTPEDVVSRLPALQITGNVLQEVSRAQQVSRLGLQTVEMLSPPDPPVPFEIPHGLDLADVTSAILRDYVAAIGPIRFPGQQGSNNWVIDRTLSKSGRPLLANDPHRAMQLPSLRKTVHLSAPGWNVMGAGEPALPGVALGHNDDVAFGFTIVGIDQQDLYVEKVNPDNANEYLENGQWARFTVVHDTIAVNSRPSDQEKATATEEEVDLKYSRHGPVIYEDPTRHRAYALRWVGELPGTAGYLSALRFGQTHNWQEFETAAAAFKVPSENLVYADRKGNIGWIAAGLAPIRKGWEGLFPVPGAQGEYEWEGYLPPEEHPTLYDPPRHFIVTANNNILPQGYDHPLAFYWASPERYQRIVEMLEDGGSRRDKKFDIVDFERMQQDTVSLVARDFVRLLERWHPAEGSEAGDLKREFSSWDGNITTDSKLALIYEVWTARLMARLTPKLLPFARTNPREVLVSLGKVPEADDLLSKSYGEAIEEVERRLGADRSRWTWGALHRLILRHPLHVTPDRRLPNAYSGADMGQVSPEADPNSRAKIAEGFDLPPVARPGDANTVNATGGGANFTESYGASYRQIVDVGDWDRSVMTNTPGESGKPGDRHYQDLLNPWAIGEYHPMPFTRQAVEAATEEWLVFTASP